MLRDLDADKVNIIVDNNFNKGSSEDNFLYSEGSDNIVYRSKGNHDRNTGFFSKDIGKSKKSYYNENTYTYI